jgi:hypothetical protein
MAMIRQAFFGPDDKPWKINEITGAAGPEIDRYDHHLVVYIDGEVPKPVIHMYGGPEKRELFESYPPFMDLIEAFWPLSYDDILMVTTLFPLDPRYATPEGVSRLHRHHSHPFFEAFLSASRGLLLYSHQLEQVCSLVQGMNPANARYFREKWNLKEPGIQELADIILIDEEHTLFNLLRKSTLEKGGGVYDADFKGAWRLYNFLNGVR